LRITCGARNTFVVHVYPERPTRTCGGGAGEGAKDLVPAKNACSLVQNGMFRLRCAPAQHDTFSQRIYGRLKARFLRFAFHLLYYQLAWTYDLVAWLVSFGDWPAWRRAAALFLREGPSLELAYGTGGLMADLTARGLAPVGLDLSPTMARLARRRLLRRGLLPRLVRGRA